MRLCRRHSVVIRPLLALTAVVLSAACGGTGPDAVRTAPGPADPGPDAPAAVSGSDRTLRLDGPRTLVLSFTGAPPGDGPCGSRLRVVAEQSPEQVRLTVLDDRTVEDVGETVACPAIGHDWRLPVELDQDLGSRPVLDADGRPLVLLTPPTPSSLPAGYRLASERGDAETFVLSYASDDGGWLLVSIGEQQGVRRGEAALVPVGQRRVAGRDVRLFEDELSRSVATDVDGRGVVVTSLPQQVGRGDRLSHDVLVEVALSVG